MKKLLLSLIILSLGNIAQATSLDEKIGQMILIGFHGSNANTKEFKTTKKQLEKGEIGSVIILKHNAKNHDDIIQMTKELKEVNSKYTPFIGLDQEGGIVNILNSENGFKDHKTAKQIANTMSLKQAYEEYSDLAKMCNDAGFNLNFAPVVDLGVNESSIIMKKERSFSHHPKIVVDYAEECIKANYDNNMVTSLKHFPGHGSVTGDTHKGFVDASKTWTEQELIPYQELSNINDLQMVMVAHVYIDKLDSKNPASLSKNIINGILRKDIGFKGVVITDDLNMGAICQNYTLKEVVINGINAGNDILLFSNNYQKYKKNTPKEVRKIVKKAIKNGEIDEKRIDESFNRIVKMKKALDNKTNK